MQILPVPKPARKHPPPAGLVDDNSLAVVLLAPSGEVLATYEIAKRDRGTLRVASAKRATNEAAIAARILAVVAGDKLIDAVLDDQQPQAPKRHRVTGGGRS